MKYTLLTLICLFTFTGGFGQPSKQGYLPDIKYDTIKFKSPDDITSTKTEISNIIVIDARFDSSSLGFYQTKGGKNYSIIPGYSLTRQVSNFLEKYLITTNNGKNIVLVLKKLWLTNECIEEPIEDVKKKTPTGTWLNGIITKFEFYCSYQDGYTPLYRFDSIFSGVSNIKDYSWEYLRDALTASVQKLKMADLNNLSSARKKMSLAEIITYSKQQFNIPISNTAIYKKGVYKTFDEFKMNSPSYSDYEIKKDKLTETIFLKGEKGEYPVRAVWGFCDGNNLYIKSSDNYFELVKKQNTFICFGAKTLTRKRRIQAANVIMLGAYAGAMAPGSKKVSYQVDRKLYQLDMETGEIY